MSDDLSNADVSPVGATRRKLLTGVGAAAAGASLLALAGNQSAEATVGNASYYSWGPFRLIDTRLPGNGGRISAGQTRTIGLLNSSYTVACNITVVNTTGGNGYLALYNADIARPNPFSSINWQGAGKIVANFAIVDIGNSGFKVYCGGSGSTNFIVDIVGYYFNNGAAGREQPTPKIPKL